MEHDLCEAAIKGDTDSLIAIIQKDPLILHKFADGCFNGAASPLHVAASNNRTRFVEELLHRQPELTEVLDSQLRSALHLASAKGHDEIVKVLVKANPEMCLVRDREGKNPLHMAAVKGKINALKELVGACPEAARDRVDRNETILHLCVKHNQLESLEKLLDIIQGQDFVNAKDNDGNTILHLAILYKRFKIVDVLGVGTYEEKETIDVNATNASGYTAMDILIHGSGNNWIHGSGNKEESDRVHDFLLKADAKRAKDLVGGDWLTNKRESLMVVASLIATMAFQAGVTPPGGVWQEDSHKNDTIVYRAGEAVMAYNYQGSYPYFLRFNTIGFVAALSTILLLMSGLKFRNKAMMWVLIVTMWLAITSMAITYVFSNVVVTPKKDRSSLTRTITIGVIVWSSVMALLLAKLTFGLVAFFAKDKSRKMKANKRIKNEAPSSRGGKGRGANPPLPLTS
ncbi:hypothetical protein RHMOL_Rhmol13G0221100 [Rhododendron molle]|uniref:Uncharacterized protein n=1 Tax=Rhododendron molle TaxID=49168 RepID=A0ACC0LAF1_RHOML|nr:hypothetical protein RHMOL_Rhmol13G0221100 [Rhododendron molle]